MSNALLMHKGNILDLLITRNELVSDMMVTKENGTFFQSDHYFIVFNYCSFKVPESE